MKLHLNSKQRAVLLEVLEKKKRIDLLMESHEYLSCDSLKLDELRELVLDEFCETGLQDDYEPNERGHMLESLIDVIKE